MLTKSFGTAPSIRQRTVRVAFTQFVWLSITPPLATAATPVRSLLETRHDHVIMQEWDLSCGAAALATLLTYQHGDRVSERDIAKALIKRDEYISNPALVKVRHGFSLLDLKRYVDKRGYEGNGYGKLEFEDLIERAPIMVPIRINGYNHFVIFRGALGNRVLLADPAWGTRTMTINRFQRVWIEFPGFGNVGFTVTNPGKRTTENKLAPNPEDFFTLR
jgi:predicted double-glycine peptidase